MRLFEEIIRDLVKLVDVKIFCNPNVGSLFIAITLFIAIFRQC